MNLHDKNVGLAIYSTFIFAVPFLILGLLRFADFIERLQERRRKARSDPQEQI